MLGEFENAHKAIGAEVTNVNKAEQPDTPVNDGLLQASPNAGSLSAVGSIQSDTVVGKLPLLRAEPTGL